VLSHRALAVLSAVLCVVAAAAIGFAVGTTRAPSGADAADAERAAKVTAARDAELDGEREARPRGEAAGREAGARRGKAAGDRVGRTRAKRVLARRARRAAQLGAQPAAAAAAPAPTPDAEDLPLSTPGPQPVNGTCAPPFSYHMGICKIARPARPDECPAGSEPAGLTGACAPRE